MNEEIRSSNEYLPDAGNGFTTLGQEVGVLAIGALRLNIGYFSRTK